jgi:signal peptidase II
MIFFVIIVCIIVSDQMTKFFIRQHMLYNHSIPVIHNFLNFTYIRNRGAVWGLFPHGNEWLILFSVAVLIFLAVFFRKITEENNVYKTALALMIGGISGNFIDRIKFGWVTDFIDFYIVKAHWPAFNIADSAICIGVTLYITYTLYTYFRKKTICE